MNWQSNLKYPTIEFNIMILFNGQILRDGVEVRRRWAEYFDQVLNVADVREANINIVGNLRMLVLGDLNERAISLEEVGEAVNEMKSGKAIELD